MSSRNGYLTTEEKQRATRLYQTLNQVVILLEGGRQDLLRMEQEAESCLEAEGWQVDYIAIRDASTLGLPSTDTQRFVVLGAAKLGKTRLIDNIEFCAKYLN
jgi:pantoate--beta-alanine ligase